MLNLKTHFGKQFRVKREEGSEAGDPYGLLIECRHGHIYLHGLNRLGASTNSRGPIAKQLAALLGVTVVQDGSDGINATFEPEQFEAVAAIIRPKRRRRLSAEHRAKLAASNLAHRYASGASGESGRSDRRATAAEITSAA
jgi:hypothetical protein